MRAPAFEVDFERIYGQLAALEADELDVVPGVEWLQDNDYVIQQAASLVRANFPRDGYRRLPVITSAAHSGQLRALVLADELVNICGSPLDLGWVRQFLNVYQDTVELTLGELWALPNLLRLVVLQRLVNTTRAVLDGNGTLAGSGRSQTGPDTDRGGVIAGLILSLRALDTQDWTFFVEAVSIVHQTLSRDPAHAYAQMDRDTRNRYRSQVERIARRTDRGEGMVARQAIVLSEDRPPDCREAHVGFYLLDEGFEALVAELNGERLTALRLIGWFKRHTVTWHLGGIALLTTALLTPVAMALAFGASVAVGMVAAPVALILTATVAIHIVNWLVGLIRSPTALPKLDFSRGIAPEFRTVVVTPALLGDAEEIEQLLNRLEMNFLANPDHMLRYVLLTDPMDADTARTPEDEARLARVVSGIEALNQRHGTGAYQPFALYHRSRQWNAGERRYMAWERKRGKLAEFNQLLLGDAGQDDRLLVGDAAELREARFVITLDADTQLLPGAARALTGTLAHPLNRPVLEGDSLRAGYTMIQPRLMVDPVVVGQNLFTRAYAGDVVLDPYTHAVSDVYQDLFGIGIFAGKGIYDVQAFERCLAGRVPENAILSHDLFEGLHGRVGLATDIVLFEDYPDNLLAYARRAHRWIRGDWQLLPWLAPRVPAADGGRVRNRFTMLGRWMLLDNIRRSLVSPAILLGLLLAWTVLPGPAWAWASAVLIVTVVPIALGSVHAMGAGLAQAGTLLALIEHVSVSMHQEATRWVLVIVFLPYESYVALDAAGRTLWRLCVSRRHLLQWVAAAHTSRVLRSSGQASHYWREMAVSPLTAALVGTAVYISAPAVLPQTLPLLLGWLAAPGIAHLIAQTHWVTREIPELGASERRRLRQVAMRTWMFFEQFAGPASHWLPPDNHHEAPETFTSQRTSPTNVGLMLLSVISAWDLGYLGSATLLSRLRNSFENLRRLERYRGHLYNWYALDSLESLEPRYVSTVDSGNLAGCLIALEQGLEEVLETPISTTKLRAGLIDVLDDVLTTAERVLGEKAAPISARVVKMQEDAERCPMGGAWPELLKRLASADLPALQSDVLAAVGSSAGTSAAEDVSALRRALNQLRSHLRVSAHEVDLLPWLRCLRPEERSGIEQIDAKLVWLSGQRPPLRELPVCCEDLLVRIEETIGQPGLSEPERKKLESLKDRVAHASETTRSLVRTARELTELVRRWLADMDFGFLYDADRHLLHIGYHVTAGELDPNYYDLLASEARLASYVAIAKQDVPEDHWLHLGRPFARIGDKRALVSWSATSFEYFMPHLLMAAPAQSLIAESCQIAAEEQQAFAREMNVPWGISESGYYQLDKQAHYQYRAFGIPGLGLRPEAGYRLVIAPYASALALPFAPREVVSNFELLASLNMLGRYGFFEAVDFGAADAERRAQIVRSYMSHHQGMILAAINNTLNDNVLIQRFHRERRMAGYAHLLYERVPSGAAQTIGWRGTETQRPVTYRPHRLESWSVQGRGDGRQLNVLSNGHYQILLSDNGTGGSTWNGLCLSRWRADPCEPDGNGLFVKDLESGALWSLGADPIPPSDPSDVDVRFAPHMAEFHRRDHGVHLTGTTVIAGDDDVEIQRLVVTNDTDRRRRLLLVSYREPVLAPSGDHERHPAFSKLFIETAELAEDGVLTARRRSRKAGETPVYVALGSVEFGARQKARWLFSDRRTFLGRNGSRGKPALLLDAWPPAADFNGSNLDPLMGAGLEIELPPRGATEIAFLFAVGHSRSDVLSLVDRYRSLPRLEWALQRAQQRSERVLADMGIAPSQIRQALSLLSGVLRADPRLRAIDAARSVTKPLQPVLWSRGISGDLPLLLLQVRGFDDVRLAEELVRIHAYWDRQQVAVDLVLLDSEIGGYSQPTRTRLTRLVDEFRDLWRHYTQGSVYIVPAAELTSEDRQCLLAAAWLVVEGDRGSLPEQLSRLDRELPGLPAFVSVPASPLFPESTPPLTRPLLLHDNGLGGFSEDGREYVIHLKPDQRTPAPWYNVIANPAFGFMVGESGAMCSWAGNSGERRLSPWHNDPVLDPSGETVYLRDEETGRIWSPTPQPAPDGLPYEVRHGAGYTLFRHASEGLTQELKVFVDTVDPVKLIGLTLTNHWQRARRLTVTCCVEWVLGVQRALTRPYLVSDINESRSALLVWNGFTRDRDRISFLAASEPLHGFTTDRVEFFGIHGNRRTPAALERIGLSDTIFPVADPCAAEQIHVDLEPGETVTVHFLLGQGADAAHAAELVDRYRSHEALRTSWARVQEFWDDQLGALTVQTPDEALDVMVNRWLLYQALACRLWGRAALYQSGGGYGFRDQLQDVMAFCATQPALARAQILRAASVQFEAGDVLHWWHEEPLRGVRTRFSDDKLWLPYVTAHYVRTTGDEDILSERVPFLIATELDPKEAERYAEYGDRSRPETLLEHCLRALDSGSGRGYHGLPLIGAGDWNDGLDRLGIGGQGESVWLGWFLCAVYRDYAELCERVGKTEQVRELNERADRLLGSVEAAAWDGEWYVRAYDDNGMPVGSSANDECSIELIAQVWSVLAGARSESRVRQAMASVERYLMGDGILRLLTPPFEHTATDPGYIRGYPPGVRENGAQYTHAASWAGWAWARLGDAERTMAVFECLNPVRHSDSPESVRSYRVEPYVVAADIYGVPPYLGRGGWTWYTGAAGLTYRLAVEVILGIRRAGHELEIRPCMPERWPGYQATLQLDGRRYRIVVERCSERAGLYLNGVLQPGDRVPLDGEADSIQEIWLGLPLSMTKERLDEDQTAG